MAARTRTPNTALAGLVAEAGWTNGQLARAVNRLGVEARLTLHYDDSAVCHWLRGTLPRAEVRPLICEALARRLGRPVRLTCAGFGSPPDGHALQHPAVDPDLVADLIDLGSADMDPSRRAVLGAVGLYSAAQAVPGWEEIGERIALLRTNPHVRVGAAEVDAVRSVTRHLSDLDDQLGGRAARPMAAAFLVNTIAPYLAAEATPGVHAKMLSAASEHCYLTGYMAVDERADGLGQRYYGKALELARLAGDQVRYCTALRGMSVQATDLGHRDDARRLAEAASAASPKAGPQLRAFLAGQEAQAAAQSGDRAKALRKLAETEVALDRSDSWAEIFGRFTASSLNYVTAQVRYEFGDRAAAVEALDRADRVRESTFQRDRVRNRGVLAERKLELGLLEEACREWGRMLDDYPAVQSGRCDDRFTTMMAALRPHLRNRRAKALHERGRTIARRPVRPA